MSDTKTEVPSAAAPRAKGPIYIRVIRIFGWTAIGLGLFLIGFVIQQLFVTTYFAQQANVERTEEAVVHFDQVEVVQVPYVPGVGPVLAPVEQEVPTPVEGEVPTPDVPVATLYVEDRAERGDAFAILWIPTLDRLADGWAIVEGVSRRNLRNGAGHMPHTPLPGQPGNAVISGHRTTYGAPFHELDELVPGDLIEVETAIGVHTYAVESTVIVGPRELWVIDEREGAWLTLTTCHPKFSSRQRLVVFAELVGGPNAPAILGS
jgi:LPXTG-site transpeptidase (sortase) family protein